MPYILINGSMHKLNWVLCVYVWVFAHESKCPRGPEVTVGSSGAGVT